MEVFEGKLPSGEKEITVEDVYRLKDELLQMSGPDCNIAEYVRVLDDAAEKHFAREETFFETNEHVFDGIKEEVSLVSLGKKAWNKTKAFIYKTAE